MQMKSISGLKRVDIFLLIAVDSFVGNYLPFQKRLDKSALITMNLRSSKCVVFRLSKRPVF